MYVKVSIIEVDLNAKKDLQVLKSILVAADGEVTLETSSTSSRVPDTVRTESKEEPKKAEPPKGDSPAPAEPEQEQESEAPADDVPEVSRDDIQKACKKLVEKGKKSELANIFKSVEASKLSEVLEKDYHEVLHAIEALL